MRFSPDLELLLGAAVICVLLLLRLLRTGGKKLVVVARLIHLCVLELRQLLRFELRRLHRGHLLRAHLLPRHLRQELLIVLPLVELLGASDKVLLRLHLALHLGHHLLHLHSRAALTLEIAHQRVHRVPQIPLAGLFLVRLLDLLGNLVQPLAGPIDARLLLLHHDLQLLLLREARRGLDLQIAQLGEPGLAGEEAVGVRHENLIRCKAALGNRRLVRLAEDLVLRVQRRQRDDHPRAVGHVVHVHPQFYLLRRSLRLEHLCQDRLGRGLHADLVDHQFVLGASCHFFRHRHPEFPVADLFKQNVRVKWDTYLVEVLVVQDGGLVGRQHEAGAQKALVLL